jgi:prepilin-type N-terminal cleavage/methylation domain-containing protein
MKTNVTKKGFTLVEILLSAAIALFVVLGVYAVLNIGNATWFTDMGMLDLQQEARLAMDGITREIRQSSSSGMSITNGGEKVEFYIPGVASSISYSLQNNQLVREHPAGTEKVLANDLTSLNFSLATDTVSVLLAFGKTAQNRNLFFSLAEKVRLRNE